MKAYHFVGKYLRDGRKIPENGVPLIHHGHVQICKSGLHASLHPFDALTYAPGNTLCLVECKDIVSEEYDKFVCRNRTIIKRTDASDLLWEMSRWSALQVIHLWNPPNVVLQFLKTGDSTLRVAAWVAAGAARDAAGVAGDAARAAWVAAGAARDAAGVARDAAGVARDAAGAAWVAAGVAGDAAGVAALAKQRDKFQELVDQSFK